MTSPVYAGNTKLRASNMFVTYKTVNYRIPPSVEPSRTNLFSTLKGQPCKPLIFFNEIFILNEINVSVKRIRNLSSLCEECF